MIRFLFVVYFALRNPKFYVRQMLQPVKIFMSRNIKTFFNIKKSYVVEVTIPYPSYLLFTLVTHIFDVFDPIFHITYELLRKAPVYVVLFLYYTPQLHSPNVLSMFQASNVSSIIWHPNYLQHK